MEDITITAQQICDGAKTALANAPAITQAGFKAACDKACEGLDTCELPQPAEPQEPADGAGSGFEQDWNHLRVFQQLDVS